MELSKLEEATLKNFSKNYQRWYIRHYNKIGWVGFCCALLAIPKFLNWSEDVRTFLEWSCVFLLVWYSIGLEGTVIGKLHDRVKELEHLLNGKT